jgi:hypothetical protein
MTRQNVTDGPREILAKKCPVCAGDGIVVSEATAAVELEQRLKALVRGSRSKVFRVEMNAHVANLLIGPGAQRLAALEEAAKRRLVIDALEDVPLDHLEVVAHGPKAEPEPGPVKEGSEVSLKLVEIGRHDGNAGVGKLDGVDVQVAGGGSLIGKRVRARVERVMNGTGYATLVSPAPRVEDPITAEDEAERPTRRRKAKAAEEAPEVVEAAAEEPVEEEEEEEEVAAVADEAPPPPDQMPKRKTRRGTRGGRGRKRKPAAAAATNGAALAEDAPEAPAARIHVPPETLGEEEPEPESVNGGAEVAATDGGEEQPVKPKRKTRRGTRGGRNRKRKPAAASASTTEVPAEPTPE